MEIFRGVPHFDFMSMRKWTLIGSAIVVIVSIASLGYQGLNLGIDFTGGIVVEAHYKQPVELTKVRATLRKGGFPDATVQHFGASSDALIHLRSQGAAKDKAAGTRVGELLIHASPKVEIRRTDVIGAEVGSDLASKGITAIVLTLVLILVYLWFRFERRLAIGGVIATLHDIVFLVGFLSVFRVQFDLTVLAAILAVMGYSINDTVVVFDRIREDFRKRRRAGPREIVNLAINETLSRTIMTSGMTLIVVVAMLIVGGPVLHGFSLTLLVGILIGTYSSIYMASGVALLFGISKQDLMIKKKEDLVDDQP